MDRVQERAKYLESLAIANGRPWTDADHKAFQDASDRWDAANPIPSPIEQEIIDGKLYWDAIATDWFRLIETRTHDVIGHCRIERILALVQRWTLATGNTVKTKASD